MSNSAHAGGMRSHLRRYLRLTVLLALFAGAWGIITASSGSGPAEAQANQGEPVYQQNCAGCHGPEGEGGVGPALGGVVDEHGLNSVRQTIRDGRPPMMPAWEGILTTQQINAVADYVATFEGDGHDHDHDTTTTVPTTTQPTTTTTTQPTTTTTQATTTTTQATTTTTMPGTGGTCVTATGAEHHDAGRAEGLLWHTAVGSGDSLGLWFTTTSLQETSPGYWTRVDSCEGGECSFFDWLLGRCDPSGGECSLIGMLFGLC